MDNFDLIRIKINDFYFQLPKGFTIFQACASFGYDIPRFCYHEHLSIAGNCRMCLVEISSSPKLVASCAMPVLNNVKIFIDNARVRVAREGVLEYLLSNHPLDCPVCDQGGECDLQDITIFFGWDKGRFYEYKKRAVENKNLGPLIKTVMTRCIHCTRCVRFFNEVCSTGVIGVTGRGILSEIGSYVDSFVLSELSGNVIDLCPVGALTSKPYSFVNRPWELTFFDSVDILDSLGSNIRVDVYLDKVVRVLPRFSSILNESWISDKTRFSYDFLFNQRLQAPWFKTISNTDAFVSVSWLTSLRLFFMKLLNSRSLYVFLGDFVDLFTLASAKDFFSSIGSSNFSFSGAEYFNFFDFRFSYLVNLSLKDLEQSLGIFLMNLDLRLELPLLNYRIRRNSLKNPFLKVFSAGYVNSYPGFEVTQLGNSLLSLLNFLEGKSSSVNFFSSPSKLPLFIFDSKLYNNFNYSFLVNHALYETLSNVFASAFFSFVSAKLNLFRPDWLGINFVNASSARLNAVELGFSPGLNYTPVNLALTENVNLDNSAIFFLINFDDKLNNILSSTKLSNIFTIYQGHHADEAALSADLILPGVTFLEKDTLYLNLLGFVQQTNKIITLYKHSKYDWEIFKALYFYKFLTYKFNFSIFFSFYEVFAFFASLISYNKFSHFSISELFLRSYYFSGFTNLNNFFLNAGFFLNLFLCWHWFFNQLICFIPNSVYDKSILNYYQSDTISRFSKVLILCSKYFLSNRVFLTEK